MEQRSQKPSGYRHLSFAELAQKRSERKSRLSHAKERLNPIIKEYAEKAQ